MSALSATVLPPIWPRAVLVLLVTLLVQALLLEQVPVLLAGAQPAAPIEAARVSARLLAPPAAVRARRPAMPRPKAPVARPTPTASTPVAQSDAAVGQASATDADRAEPTAAVERDGAAVSEAVPDPAPDVVAQAAAEPDGAHLNAEQATATSAAATAIEFEAAGPALQRALAVLPAVTAALPAAARYVYRTHDSELRLSAATVFDWAVQDDRYTLRMFTTTLGLTAIELAQGRMRPFGLAPERYTETRIRPGAVAANFDWDGRRVTFRARTHERPTTGGGQDRISFQFQLMPIGQPVPERYRRAAETVMHVAGRDDVTAYRFRSIGRDRTSTGVGELDTVRIERLDPDAPQARIDVWLAPEHGWLPVRLRFTDRHGRSSESVLASGVPA